MTLRQFAIVLALLQFTSSPAVANPVPDEVAGQFHDLVSTTARFRFCPNPEQLSRYFSAYGLGLLSPEQVAGIERRFNTFAPVLVRSQGRDGALRFEIQEMYRKHANEKQRSAMVTALRHWLTDDIQEAPAGGGMQIMGPASAVREAIEEARATAAEMLSDWGDRDAIPLIEAVERRGIVSEQVQRRLRVARARFDDPCVGQLVRNPPNGPVRLCAKRDNIVSATLKDSYRSRELTNFEFDRVWEALPAGVWDEASGEGLSSVWISLELTDGSTATLCPAGPWQLSLEEDSTSNRRLRRTMTNLLLFNLVQGFEPPPSQ